MKAVVCVKPGELSLQEWPAPNLANCPDGHVLIKVERVGLCGTDYHIYTGDHPYLEYPRVMGHELSGVVAETGPSSTLTKGELVIINPYIACESCVACRKGKPNCCTDINVLGVHGHGGMCDYVVVPESAVYPAGELTADQAAMVEFLSVGAHAVRRGETAKNDRVLIVGMGPIGLGTALFARIAGAQVTVMDTNAARVAKARDVFGFDQAVQVGGAAAKALEAYTDGDYFDLVFDATGNAKAIEVGFNYIAHGGSYVLVSVVKGDIQFTDAEFHKREMRLIGSRNATRADFEHVVANIQNGNVDTDALHTHGCALKDLPEMLPKWMGEADHVIKAIVRVE